jgi:hypothetical protein
LFSFKWIIIIQNIYKEKPPYDNLKDKIEKIVESKVDELVEEKIQQLVQNGDI